MTIHPIHSKSDYEKAVRRIEAIFDARSGTSEGDELEILGILVDDYEKRNYPIHAPEPVEAVKFRMDQMGLTQSDLANIVGSKSRASEILSGKRSMSLRVIRILNQKLGIPAEVLIQQEEPVA
jgi:HTH-type transcriptional regulator/antitoxin HigA